MKAVDILIFGGQSNMQGQTERLSETDEVVGAYEYRYTSNSLVPLKNPVGEDVTYNLQLGYPFLQGCNAPEWREAHVLGSACYGHTNLVPAFCRAYLAQTHGEVIAVHAAKGSTQIHDWLPGTAGFDTLVKKSRAAIEKAKNEYTVGKIYFVWLQGESDAIFSVSRETYRERLVQLNDALKKELGINVFGIIRVGRFVNDARDDEIIDAQTEICLEHPDFLMLTDKATEFNQSPAHMNPNVGGHYSVFGLEELGGLAGETLGKYRTN